MSTTIDPAFLRSVVMLAGFRGNALKRAQAGLIYLALERDTFTAAHLPAELTTNDDTTQNPHLAGAAAGSLIAIGLLTVIGRERSPNPSAKGRKVNTLTLTPGKRNTALTWLRLNGYLQPEPQLKLHLSA